MNTWTRRSAVAVVAAGFALSASVPALANDSDVIKRGSCSNSTNWKPDNGRLEVEGEVDSNRNGQTWHWRILHDGDVSARGTATTKAPSGSFSVTRRVVNTPGSDRIGWRAVNRASGETCRGNLTI